jgi:ribosomal protein S18 acetylase RimI-like enzyme
MTDLALAVAFSRTLLDRLAEHRVRTRYGVAHFVDSLPRVWWLNTLSVDLGARATLEELIADADEVQGGGGLAHRRIAVDDELGAEVEDGFRELGWRVARLLVMADGGTDLPAAARAVVAEVPAQEAEAAWSDGIRTELRGIDEDALRQLVAARHLRRQAVTARYFAAVQDGRVASSCELYSDGSTAQIESVFTLEELRGRGLGTAVVSRALGEARKRHDLTFLVTDDEGRAQRLYRRLGFEGIGRIWDFVREPPR